MYISSEVIFSAKYFQSIEDKSKESSKSSNSARKRYERIESTENSLTSVPMQNVNFAELTGIERILNVLLRKKKKTKEQSRKKSQEKSNPSLVSFLHFFFQLERTQICVYVNIFLYIVCLFTCLEARTNEFQFKLVKNKIKL